MIEYHVITWDWKEQMPLSPLRYALKWGFTNVSDFVDTGSDEYAIVLSTELLNTDQVQQAWDEYLERRATLAV